MADLVWPAALPAPQVRTLTEAPQSTVQRTKMSVGPDKVRRRTTFAIREFNIELKTTRAKVAIFDEFFHDTLKGGSLPFEVPHPRTGVTIDARIKNAPKYKPLAARGDGTEAWTITFEMETFPAAAAVVEPSEPSGELRGSGLVGDDPMADVPGDGIRDDEPDSFIMGTFAPDLPSIPVDWMSYMWGDQYPESITEDDRPLELIQRASDGGGSTHGEDPISINPGGFSGVSES